jgi:hypothetical protein
MRTNRSLLVDPSSFTDASTVSQLAEEVYELPDDFDVLLPAGFSTFAREVSYDRYRDSAVAKFYGKYDRQQFAILEDLCSGSQIVDYRQAEQVDGGLDVEEYREEVEDAISWYKRFSDWEVLYDCLLSEVQYLYTNSVIGAAGEKFLDVVERIGGLVINAGEDVRDQVIDSMNYARNHPVAVGKRIFKFVIVAVGSTMIGIPVGGGEAIQLLETLLENALGDYIAISLDP